MLKKTLILIAFLFVGSIYSQDKTRDEVLQLIADDTCVCINEDKASFAADKTMNQKQMALGLCLLKSYNKRKTESKAFSGKSSESFEEIGEEVGFKMATTCGDDFIALFSDDQLGELLEEDDEYSDMPAPPAAKSYDDLNIEAKLVSLNNDAISYIVVTDDYDKEHTFIVSNQFEGYEHLKKSNYNKSFRIFFEEKNYFDLSERRYVKKKVIKYLEQI